MLLIIKLLSFLAAKCLRSVSKGSWNLAGWLKYSCHNLWTMKGLMFFYSNSILFVCCMGLIRRYHFTFN